MKALSKLDSIVNFIDLPGLNSNGGDSLNQTNLSVGEQKIYQSGLKVQQKVDTIGQKITEGVNNAAGAVESKIQQIAIEGVNLPAGKLPERKLHVVPNFTFPALEDKSILWLGNARILPNVAALQTNVVTVPNGHLSSLTGSSLARRPCA